MTSSKFDPLDMALGALTAPGRQSPTATSHPQPDAAGPPAVHDPPARRATGRSKRPAPKHTSKGQLNVYMPTEQIETLRQAVIQLGGRYSLGDIVSQLVDAALDEVIDQLNAHTPPGPTRLRPGPRIS